MPYEEVYATPMIFKLPGNIDAGSTRSQPDSLLDLAPTFCEVAEPEVPFGDGASFQIQSILGLIGLLALISGACTPMTSTPPANMTRPKSA